MTELVDGATSATDTLVFARLSAVRATTVRGMRSVSTLSSACLGSASGTSLVAMWVRVRKQIRFYLTSNDTLIWKAIVLAILKNPVFLHSGARCKDDRDCGASMCCAWHHGEQVCKRRLFHGEICYVGDGGLAYKTNQLCPCDQGLVCRQNAGPHVRE